LPPASLPRSARWRLGKAARRRFTKIWSHRAAALEPIDALRAD
jgi:hypothetical protein